VRAKARFENTDNKLFPSQFVNLRLQVRTIEGAVVVPVNALRHGANGDFVYVLNPQEKHGGAAHRDARAGDRRQGAGGDWPEGRASR
jgi:multidrug efflux pump subunit AcrA (membrane-fusion protein)